MKKKLLITGGLLVIIFVVSVVLIFNYGNGIETDNLDNDDSNKVNTNITKEQNINGIVFTNITCDFDGFDSILEYTVINKTQSIVNLGEYEIIVKDKDGNVIANMINVLEQDIRPDEEVKTGSTININLEKADSIELVLD